MGTNLKAKAWWNFIDEDIRELLLESFTLLEFVEKVKSEFVDYSFVVFPAAKAYEGFLKKVFLDLGFISSEDYFGKHFRIGKALNPSLGKDLRQESIYDKLTDYCGNEKIADILWQTWKYSRNLVFHWFPNEKNVIDLSQAKERTEMIIKAIDVVFKECKIKTGKPL